MVSQTVYFTGMVNHRFSPLHHRSWDVPKNISTRASTRTSTWVLVHEYEYKYEYYYFGTHEYEYCTSTRNSVLEYCEYEYRVRVPQPWAQGHYDAIGLYIISCNLFIIQICINNYNHCKCSHWCTSSIPEFSIFYKNDWDISKLCESVN